MPSVLFQPSYDIEYGSDLTQISILAAKEVNAYVDSNLAPQSIVIGASSNVNLEAFEGVNVYFNSNDAVTFFNYDISGSNRTDIELFKIQKSLDETILTASNLKLKLMGTDAAYTTTVSKTTITDSNNFQIFNTEKDAFQLENPVYLTSNLVVEDSIVGHNNLCVTGNIFSPTVNFYKNVVPTAENSNLSQVAYAFYINEYDQLGLLKFDKYGTSNITTQLKHIGAFGTKVTDGGRYVGDPASYQVLNQFNGVDGTSNTGAVASVTGKMWSVGVNSPANIYYTAGYVGIGISAPASALHVVGDVTAGGHVIPDTNGVRDLGSVVKAFKDVHLSGDANIAGNVNLVGDIYKNGQLFSSGLSGNGNTSYIYGSNFAVGKSNAATTVDVAGAITAVGYCNLLVSDFTSKSLDKAATASNVSFLYNLIGESTTLATAGLKASSNLSDLTNVAQARTNLGLGTDSEVAFSNISLTGTFAPMYDRLQDIGSSNLRFKEAWIETLHIAQNTLYIGEVPVLGTNADSIQVKADSNQNVEVSTSGTARTLISSTAGVDMYATAGPVLISASNGNAALRADGAGRAVTIAASGTNSAVNVTAGTDITLSTSNFYVNAAQIVNGAFTVMGDISCSGNMTVTGCNFVTAVETKVVAENIIVCNDGEPGAGVTSSNGAGLEIDRGFLPRYRLVFKESDGMFSVGMLGQEEVIATRTWVGTNVLKANSNLSDIQNAGLARNNLGLGATCNVIFNNANIASVNAASYANLINNAVSTSTTMPVCGNALRLVNDLALATSNHAYRWQASNGCLGAGLADPMAAIDVNYGSNAFAMLRFGSGQTANIAVLTHLGSNWNKISKPNDTAFVAHANGVDDSGGIVFSSKTAKPNRGMRFDGASGYLSINNSNAIFPLDVHNSNAAAVGRFKATTGVDGAYVRAENSGAKYIDVGVGGVTALGGTANVCYINSSSNNPIYINNNVGIGTATPSGALHVVGTIYATQNVVSASDRRLKTNFSEIEGALGKVKQLTGYNFNRIDFEGAPRDTGLIAQEVQAVLPEAVAQDENGFLRLAYGNLAGLFVNAIKELAEEVRVLKAELALLQPAA